MSMHQVPLAKSYIWTETRGYNVKNNRFPAIYDNCRLLGYLMVYLGRQYFKTLQTQIRSSLIRVHSVYFHYKSSLKCIWIYQTDVNKQRKFSGQNIVAE